MIKDRIAAAMKARKLAPLTVAEKAGMSESTIKRILYGATADPGVQTLQAIAAALDVPLGWLIEEYGDADTVPPSCKSAPDEIPAEPDKIESERKFAPDEVKFEPPTEPENEPTEPIGEPNEPTDEPTEPEDEDMKLAIEAVVQAYRERLDEIKAQYLSQIADLKRDKRVLAIAAAALVIFIITFFSYDILNPSVGWFRY